jgi:hypothetical protein
MSGSRPPRREWCDCRTADTAARRGCAAVHRIDADPFEIDAGVAGHRDLKSLRRYYNPAAEEIADRLG